MAVLNKIRQRSVFLIIIIALALFSFVLADVIRNGGMSSQKSQNVVATVNGEEISREEFARQVEAYQQNMGQNASTTQAVNQVWEMKLREVMLLDEFDKLGIDVGEAQVRRALRQQLGQNPNFTNEAGMFDDNRLQEYVANLRATSPQAYQQWVAYENSIAESARENIYYNLVRAGVGATLLEGEQAYRLENDNVDIRFVQVPYTTVPDSEVEVSKDDIRNYVKKHPKRFQTEKARDIQYIFFQEEASASDEAEVREELERAMEGFRNTNDVASFVNQNSDIEFQDRFVFRDQYTGNNAAAIFDIEEGEVTAPYKEGGYWRVTKMLEKRQMADSANASHIMVTWEGLPTAEGATRTKEEAKQLADSLAQVVRRDKEKFADLATEFSADRASVTQGGDLGDFRPGDMIPAFDEFVFSNSAGTVGVVESDFGYHVINIKEKTEEKPAVKIAMLARRIEPSEQSLNDLYTKVTRFEMDAKNTSFADAAKEGNHDIRTVKDVKALDENIPGVGQQRRIIQWAFDNEVKAGDINRFELPTGYVVAQVTAVKKEGLMSAEDASSTVTPILMRDKKAEVIKNKISGNDLQQIAQNNNTSVESANAVNLKNPTIAGAGNEPKVVGAAFALEAGQVSQPIAGNRGVYVVELTAKNSAPAMESYRSFATQQTMQRRQGVEDRIFNALREKAEIEDNRANFY
ncbi:peptidylprolyl isomerase [Antarcticibacterium flavum]|uniref:Periplasmic chaperone PpiD n=1 Tax=Antarcticibacterium flavum TaxID=2058175 RepID=A0A5B7X112_9FLAO|nr:MULTISPECIES: peptidylprolyl isomerase [Antarcticibacterium]MCM4160992.1 peptidylprolyl isomerase [Antarcticibacterium sp. W02-3]QCY69284.1 peptidylprolyl isomerase [Antarcticibacterium flavum]